MSDLELRPAVKAFAQLMEHVLRANDHKGDWYDWDIREAFDRLIEESNELRSEIKHAAADDPGRIEAPEPTREQAIAIAKEAADVANFAMMIADEACRIAGVPMTAVAAPAPERTENPQ